MGAETGSWQFWALLSAAFAALTAIFAKVGVENVGSDVATFLRTLVVIVVLGGILLATGQFGAIGSIGGLPGATSWPNHQTLPSRSTAYQRVTASRRSPRSTAHHRTPVVGTPAISRVSRSTSATTVPVEVTVSWR